MSSPEFVEALQLIPNRLSVVEFSPPQVEAIIGTDMERQGILKDGFNWIAAYLVEEAGLFETDIKDWFESSAKKLGGERPIDIWQEEDGFERVVGFAQDYKRENDQYLAEDDAKYGVTPPPQSHDTARNALGIIYRSFADAGLDVTYSWIDPQETQMRAIHNPEDETAPLVRWKSCGVLEDFRITMRDGEKSLMYYIVQHLRSRQMPLILQSGVVELGSGEQIISEIDSDLDGRPPGANHVAPFVIALANETLNGSMKSLAA